jgi:RNA polymerase sigma factor (sigma-70 family)
MIENARDRTEANRSEGSQGGAPGWALLRACTSGGDDTTWSALVVRFEPQLRRFVRRLLVRHEPGREPDRVEDVLQEIYCRLLAGRQRPSARFRGETEAEAAVFLRRVAVRVLLDAERAARTGKRGGGRRTASLGPELAERIRASAADSPDAPLERCERRALFRRRCRELLGRSCSSRSVRIAELALLDGLSSAEIARRPGVRLRESGINSVVYRLRRRLTARGASLPRRSSRVE